MKLELARKVSVEAREIGARLNAILREIKENCSEEEFNRYKYGVGNAMGSILLEIMEPIYAEHPALEPEELKRGSDSGAT